MKNTLQEVQQVEFSTKITFVSIENEQWKFNRRRNVRRSWYFIYYYFHSVIFRQFYHTCNTGFIILFYSSVLRTNCVVILALKRAAPRWNTILHLDTAEQWGFLSLRWTKTFRLINPLHSLRCRTRNIS